MTDLELSGKWDQLKGKLKQQYAMLTDDDLLFTEGKNDELMGRISARIGKTKDQVRELIGKL
jgi:uncharacterized protein YjbJ (UPF0337 family)